MAKAAAGAASSGAGAADDGTAGKGSIATGGDEGAAGKGAAEKGGKGAASKPASKAGDGKTGASAAADDGDEGADEGATGDQGDGAKGGAGKGAAGKGAAAGKGGKTGSTDGEKPEAPAKYSLSLPKGADVWIDDKDLKAFEKVARAKGMTNEQAQDEINDRAEFMATQSSAFYDQTADDDTYGGDKLEETEKLARSALDRLRPKGTPRGDALRRMLVKTGYGNNLEIVSFLADLGKLMAEDKGAGSSSGATPSETAAEKLYGKTTTNTPAE